MTSIARLVVLAVGTAALVGCEENPPPIGEAIAYDLVQVWRTGDLLTAEELFHPTAVYEDRASGTEARGGPEVSAWASEISEWMDAMFIEVVDLRAGDDHAVIEWVREGAISVDEVPRVVRLEGTTVLAIESERIVRATEYFDPAPLVVARGGRVVLPDGRELVLPEVDTR